jgi:hypothetical protein
MVPLIVFAGGAMVSKVELLYATSLAETAFLFK